MKYAEEFIDEYTHFVVWSQGDGLKIESGWHYKEDAEFQLDEIQEVLDYAKKNKDGALDIEIKVISRNRLWGGYRVDLHSDDDWSSIPW